MPKKHVVNVFFFVEIFAFRGVFSEIGSPFVPPPTTCFTVIVIKNRIKTDKINSVRVVGKELVETFTSDEKGMRAIFGEIGFKSLLKMIKDLCGIV